MKTKINSYIRRIIMAVAELQTYSYTEFQKILPAYLNISKIYNFEMLDKYIASETGVSLRDYFNRVKAKKAHELLDHYRLSPVEAAYQLGFRTPSKLKKVIGFPNQYLTAGIPYREIQQGQAKVT